MSEVKWPKYLDWLALPGLQLRRRFDGPEAQARWASGCNSPVGGLFDELVQLKHQFIEVDADGNPIDEPQCEPDRLAYLEAFFREVQRINSEVEGAARMSVALSRAIAVVEARDKNCEVQDVSL